MCKYICNVLNILMTHALTSRHYTSSYHFHTVMWCTSVLSVVMSVAQFGPAPDAHDALYYKLNAANVSDVCAARV